MGKNKKKMVALLLASLTGFSSMSVASSVIVYDKIFSRYERPDYSLVLGEYCYERVQERLPRSTFKFPSKEKGVNLQGYYYPSSQNNIDIFFCRTAVFYQRHISVLLPGIHLS